MAAPHRDKHGRPLVVVTGMGVVTSLGEGKADNWAALTAGRSGIHRITRFSTENLRTTIAGTVDFIPAEPFCAPALSEQLALRAAAEAVGQAAIGRPGDFPGALFMAVPPVEMEWPQREALAEAGGRNGETDYSTLLAGARTGRFRAWHELFLFGTVAARIQERFGTKGSPISLSTACSSGATAIQLGVEAIRRGEVQAALAIGTDGSVNPESLIRFSLLSALSTQNDPPEEAAKPFSKNRDGFVMGEGAAALVLEDYDHALARGAKILGFILGCGEKGDGFHRTRSSPDGAPAIAAMREAIADAGLTPDDIDYINAHGTSTMADTIELGAVERLVGESASKISMSSTKSATGHLLGAAGAIEAIFATLAIRDNVVPPTLNLDNPDVETKIDLVPHKARKRQVNVALSNSFGFGGTNASLVLRRYEG